MRLYPETTLRPYGYELGRNLHVDTRFAEGQPERLPGLANELVALRPDVIFAGTNLAAFPLKRATSSIPIVVFASHGAMETGLVASYARPGGNITGVESLAPALDVKRLQLWRETLPQARTVAVLSNPLDQGTVLHQQWSKDAADVLKLKLITVPVSRVEELDVAYASMTAMRPDAVLVFSDALMVNWGAQIAAFALKAGFPLFGEFSLYARNGGLMSYGASLDDMAQRVATAQCGLVNGDRIVITGGMTNAISGNTNVLKTACI